MSNPQTQPPWPSGLDVRQVRIARPTDQLGAVVRFYRDGLGLPVLASFEDHAGYDGVMLGLPGRPYHLEFTHHAEGSPCPAPSLDNLLVLYAPDQAAIDAVIARLSELGHHPVEAENPFWTDHRAVTIEDPDGWRVVLMPSEGI